MDNPQHWISAPPPSDTPYTDSIARQCFHWGDLIIFMRELERKLHASERDLKTLTESIALSRKAGATARERRKGRNMPNGLHEQPGANA